ncbi:MAG: PLDc N-terminal domain-containing protein [Bacillaceae bacterium]
MSIFLSFFPLLFVFVPTILLIWALVDLIRRDEIEIAGGNKILWVIIIIFVPFFGSILYLLLGRRTL